MQQNLKLFLVGLFCLGLGAGGFYGWSQYSAAKQENARLKSQLESTPKASPLASGSAPISSAKSNAVSPTITPATTPSPAVDAKTVEQTGTITGKLGYPSEGIPPMEVYAMKQGDPSVFFKLKTKQNQQTFTITDVTPETYVVFAYPQGAGSFAGGYTKAVSCGLSVECTDHSLLPVVVAAGKTVEGVAVTDWYAQPGDFPKRPE